MRRLIACLLLVGVLFGLLPTALAQGRLASLQPSFEESGHVPPQPATPAPRGEWFAYADVVVLVLALSLASVLALRFRSRRGIVLLSVASLLYFGFWRQGCVCPVGSIQNMMQAWTDRHYAVPLAVVLFFTLPLLFALFFGRVFCAAVCPLGTLQDLVVLRPRRLPVWVNSTLGLLPYLYLGVTLTMVAGGGGYLICRYDPFVGFFRMGASFPMLVFGGGMLLLGTVVGRPYCRFLCPYGVLLNACSQLSRRHVSITPTDCVTCRLCEGSCPFDAIEKPTPTKANETRSVGVRRLVWLLALLPVLVVGGAWLGSRMAVPMSRLSDTVLLAERLSMEEAGLAEVTVATEGFRRSKEVPHELYARALDIRTRLGRAGWFLGGFLGLVVGCRLLALSVHRRREGYAPHRGECVSCGRCFRYCPQVET
jgi:NosR/NirI family nitrous oxide reductase transcriptional regulator